MIIELKSLNSSGHEIIAPPKKIAAVAASPAEETCAQIKLRHLAEEHLRLRQSGAVMGEADPRRLLHELQVHQIELEMQNEALRESQSKTAAALHELKLLNQQVGNFVQSRSNELAITKGDAEQSASLHSTILENMPSGVQLTRIADAVIVYTNPVFEQMFGYAQGELLGRHIGNLCAQGRWPPADNPEQLNPILGRRGAWSGEMCNVRKDGEQLWCLVKASTFDHATFGKVWVSTHTDITDRVDLQNQVAEQNRTLERAVSGAELAVWDWDVASGCVEGNDRLHALLGSSVGEVALNVVRLLPIIHPDDLDAAWVAFERHMSDETTGFQAGFRLRHKAGHWVWVLVRGRVVARNTEGKALHAAGTMIDVSQQKEILFESGDLLRRVETIVREAAHGGNGHVSPLTEPLLSNASMKATATAKLSARQTEVLRLVAEGLTSQKISEWMNIAKTTVNAHRRDIMRKLGLHSASALTRFAIS